MVALIGISINLAQIAILIKLLNEKQIHTIMRDNNRTVWYNTVKWIRQQGCISSKKLVHQAEGLTNLRSGQIKKGRLHQT